MDLPPTTPGFWRRIAAIGYDALLVFSLLFFATIAFQAVTELIDPAAAPPQIAIGTSITEIDPVVSGPLYSVYLLLVIFAFFAYFWRRSGQTLGMQAWRLRVCNLQGGAISFKQCVLRFAVAWVSALALGGGYLWILIDSEKRAWHDICSQTRLNLVPKKK